MTGKLWWLILVAMLASGNAASLMAEVKVPTFFSDGMVLQRDRPIPVWGWAAPGEKITVSLANRQASTTADADGNWMVRLRTLKAGGPYVLTVRGSTTLEIRDVLVGEVWICSGQSNMAWPLGQAENGEREVAEAKYPMIRQFQVPCVSRPLPQADVDGRWRTCSPTTAGAFSAVGYFFARELHKQLGVPVGLINNAWSGMTIEPYTPYEALKRVPGMTGEIARVDAAMHGANAAQAELDARIAAHKKSIAEAIPVEADEAAARKLADPALNTSDWKEMMIPRNWKTTTDLADYDGIVWFRKTVDIPADWAGKNLALNLCPIDETDVTWFNGVEVGRTGSLQQGDFVSYWNVCRHYTVPGSAVRAGKATIAIRVISTAFAAGLWSEKPVEMNLRPAGDQAAAPLALDGAWQYKPVCRIVPMPVIRPSEAMGSFLWNAMVRPLVPYGIRGAIWYQGESNLEDGLAYTEKMRAMITGWRKAWDEGDFPFYYVQLAPYNYGVATPEKLALLWEAQTDALAIPNTGMAGTSDVGTPTDIHPRKKLEVGHRLALWALAKTYGKGKIVYSGPMFKSAKFRDGKASVRFNHVGGGLASRDGKDLTWFTIAGPDKQFVSAQARIEGDTVTVWSEKVPKPAAVRFAWDQVAQPNLMNAEGLPAIPFRSDAP